ncbi:hypothetical protein F5X96DRAFT_236115 [Biscogniauxia mediterranea]|nr:hypothetical protein F5X96DRAFT_236115 [Biscogniauxia mediterranea]
MAAGLVVQAWIRPFAWAGPKTGHRLGQRRSVGRPPNSLDKIPKMQKIALFTPSQSHSITVSKSSSPRLPNVQFKIKKEAIKSLLHIMKFLGSWYRNPKRKASSHTKTPGLIQHRTRVVSLRTPEYMRMWFVT